MTCLEFAEPAMRCQAILVLTFFSLVLGSVTVGDSQSSDYSLSYSTFLGGVQGDTIRDVAFGPQGSVYITGGTESSDFPTTSGAHDRSFNGDFDVFVAKFDAAGNLLWSTFLGGPNYDRAYALEVDAQGHAYVAGRAGAGYPTTGGVVQPGFGGDVNPLGAYGQQDGFVTKLAANGSGIVWSTYFGGDDKDVIRDLDIDGSGNVYLAVTAIGRQHPHITQGVFQPSLAGGTDHVVAKLSSDGRQVLYASYLGGSGDDGWPPSIRVDSAGNAYFLGHTFSNDFPVTPNAIQSTPGGNVDLFLSKISANASSLLFSTYIGGNSIDGTETHGLALDSAGNAYVAAGTKSTNLPTTPGAFQGSYRGTGGPSTGGNSNYQGDGFVMKISANGSNLLGCTYLGGSEGEGIEGVDVDAQGNVYVSGSTYSHNFPVTAGAVQANLAGTADFFLASLSADLKQERYATFLGGSNIDYGRAIAAAPTGPIAIGGMTLSSNWPTFNAWQANFGGGADVSLALIENIMTNVFGDGFETGSLGSWSFIAN
jgi:hypothetical protein